jgi:hypothetical protein
VELLLQNMRDTIMSQVTKIQTSLYDLVAILNAERSPDEDNIVTATIIHLLSTHRVTYTGALRGYRLVCNGRARSVQTLPKGYDCFSQFESYNDHYERLRHRIIS